MAAKKIEQGKNRITLEGTIPKLSLSMPLDAAKTKAIQRCIEKGTLNITVSKVDLQTGKIGDAWLYD
ncbi:MAG: hypothetical protein JNM66_13010 [Bryobacterales bacterium]|nr:hypothetical protein [Bryobacterales bacterium]